MKLKSGLLVLGAALNAAVTVGEEVRELAASSDIKSGVTFAADVRALPYDLLMGLDRTGDGNYGDSSDDPFQEPGYEDSPTFDNLECTVTNDFAINGNVTVVVAISECVDRKTMDMIAEWINSIEAPFKDLLNISSTLIPGGCQSISERNKRGLNDTLMAQESNAARLQQFKPFGRVLEGWDDLKDIGVNPTALISFVTDNTSYSEVQGIDAYVQFQHTFNFHICKSGQNCEGRFTNCIDLPEMTDLFAYIPIAFLRRTSCDNILPGGLPITYVDKDNQRQCYCACPAGYSNCEGVCKPVDNPPHECPWSKVDGYRKEICHAEETCLFKDIASKWKVPVPFPTDGYVADGRDNINQAQDPRVDVIVKRVDNPIYKQRDIENALSYGQAWPKERANLPSSVKPVVDQNIEETTLQSVEWKEFQKSGKKVIDGLQFTAFGKYELELDAYDYYASAKCPGCLAIVDNVRPKHTTQCPASFCDTAVNSEHCEYDAELTQVNLDKAKDLVADFYKYGDEASNDNCHQSNRCDKQVFKLQNFFEKDGENQQSSNAPTYEDGRTCFDRIEALDAFLQNNKAKENPLVNENGECRHSEDNPVQPGQCKRCCGYQTELRELWTDYKCGYDYDTRMCSGDRDEKCSFKQCLIFNGDSVATASANIKASVVAESEKVLEHIDQKTFQTVTQIHRVVDCTSFDSDTAGACNYEAKVSDLIEANAELKLDMGLYANVDDFVFWRYRVRGKDEKWQLWKNSAVTDEILTFDRAETMITIEAWTQCGKVRTFYFYVHLHLNSEIKVCDHFSQMWYQSTISLLKADDTICAYPGSDFAELTFDYHANIGLQYMRDRLNMNISRVTCTGSLDGRTPTTILDIDRQNAQIAKRFGVELVNRETTEAVSTFRVECTFTYIGYDGHSEHQTCPRSFNIKDCVGPDYDDDDQHCEYKGCAGKHKPGLYEACGGKIIRATPFKTYVHIGDGECCQGCRNGQSVECVSLLNLPNAREDLKRCQPSGGTGGAYGTTYTDDAYDSDDTRSPTIASFSAASAVVQEHPGAAALLGVSTLVAVVALVVVKRRANLARQEEMENDAYYPLLH